MFVRSPQNAGLKTVESLYLPSSTSFTSSSFGNKISTGRDECFALEIKERKEGCIRKL